MIAGLPLEIWQSAIDHLHRPIPSNEAEEASWESLHQDDLVNMMRVCSEFHNLAGRVLYTEPITQDFARFLQGVDEVAASSTPKSTRTTTTRTKRELLAHTSSLHVIYSSSPIRAAPASSGKWQDKTVVQVGFDGTPFEVDRCVMRDIESIKEARGLCEGLYLSMSQTSIPRGDAKCNGTTTSNKADSILPNLVNLSFGRWRNTLWRNYLESKTWNTHSDGELAEAEFRDRTESVKAKMARQRFLMEQLDNEDLGGLMFAGVYPQTICVGTDVGPFAVMSKWTSFSKGQDNNSKSVRNRDSTNATWNLWKHLESVTSHVRPDNLQCYVIPGVEVRVMPNALYVRSDDQVGLDDILFYTLDFDRLNDLTEIAHRHLSSERRLKPESETGSRTETGTPRMATGIVTGAGTRTRTGLTIYNRFWRWRDRSSSHLITPEDKSAMVKEINAEVDRRLALQHTGINSLIGCIKYAWAEEDTRCEICGVGPPVITDWDEV